MTDQGCFLVKATTLEEEALHPGCSYSRGEHEYEAGRSSWAQRATLAEVALFWNEIEWGSLLGRMKRRSATEQATCSWLNCAQRKTLHLPQGDANITLVARNAILRECLNLPDDSMIFVHQLAPATERISVTLRVHRQGVIRSVRQ